MKDAYSLDRDEGGMRESYRVMYDAYVRCSIGSGSTT